MFDDLPYLSRILKIINPNIDISFLVPNSQNVLSNHAEYESLESKDKQKIIQNIPIGPQRGPIETSSYGQGNVLFCIYQNSTSILYINIHSIFSDNTDLG